jgi:CBS-domain-containing membrane protein
MAAPICLLADTAADLMTAGPASIVATATVAEAAAFLTGKGFGAVVVIDEAGHPVGVVTKTDLLVHDRERGGAAGGRTPVRSVMTEAVMSVRPDTPARSVVAQFTALNVHHLFVADAGGVIVGVIGTLDVVRKLG